MGDAPEGERRFKKGRMEIRSGEPIAFHEDPSADNAPEGPSELQERAYEVGGAIKAYSRSAKELLDGRLADLRPFAPPHLKQPCHATVIYGQDGVVVRYDLAADGKPLIRTAGVDEPLSQLTPKLSDDVVHLPIDLASFDLGAHGLAFEMAKVNYLTGQSQPLFSGRLTLVASSRFPEGFTPPRPPSRPTPLVSLTNELQIEMGGVVLPADPSKSGNITRAHEFVARGSMVLKVGWQALEVYPAYGSEYWKDEHAVLWAEADLLAAVARAQLAEARYAAFDPNTAARETFRRVLNELRTLLEGPEEPAHQFLKAHPEILSPTHTAAWSKLALGKRVTDFVFREPGNDYLLVEIESPLRRLFRKDGQPREELIHAVNQITDWRIHIEDNLSDLQQNLGLADLSSDPRSLIVIGRSDGLTPDNRRKLTALQNQAPKLRIMTYDDLLESAKAAAENLFGPMDLVGQNVQVHYSPLRTR